MTEPIPGREPADVASPRPPQRTESADGLPPTLALCRACHCFIWPDETACPHCGADLAAAAARWDEDARRRMGLVAELERMMEEARAGFATGQAARFSVVRLSLGDNAELGGAVRGDYVRWNLFTDLTVEAGGEVWVKGGKLVGR